MTALALTLLAARPGLAQVEAQVQSQAPILAPAPGPDQASSPPAAAMPRRTLLGFVDKKNALEIQTSDGRYLIKAYSDDIMETAFIPTGERYDPHSEAVVLAPAAVKVRCRDTGAAIEYATAGIVATITKSPFSIAYAYKGRALIAEKNGYFRRDGMDNIDFDLASDEILYGGGSRALGMNRRGHKLKLYNKAQYGYESRVGQTSYTLPLVISSRKYALHFDNAPIGVLDLDRKKANVLNYETIGGRKIYQVIASDSWEGLTDNYTRLTGRQPLPPRWAFGNFASRFGYHSEAEARATVDKFIEQDIPLDAIIFDLYWFGQEMLGAMGNLSFVKDKFPDPKRMMADFAKKGVKTILITEPFVLTTSRRWQEAVDRKVLATKADGTPYTYDFYFGNTGLIDIFKPEAKDWFWNIYKDLQKQGVAGWWGDLGEPEIHPTDLQHVNGSADQVHNLYGHEWARMIHDGYRKDFPGQRPFILMRAGAAGSQRYGLIPWSGDVNRTWGGLQSQTEIALQMGMQGLAYMHSDLGGFAGPNLDDELYARWLQYGVFQPIFRPHAQEEVASEPVYREARTRDLAREAIRLRYRLLPYNYTLGFDNSRSGLPLMRPLMYEEPDNPQLLNVADTYLWGHEFLVTPVTAPGLQSKEIYFPANHVWFDFYSGQAHAGGSKETVALVPEHIPVFVRAGAFIPMTEVVRSTDDYSTRHVDLHYYHDRSVAAGSGKLYDDDGVTPSAFEQGKYELVHMKSTLQGDLLTLTLNSERGAQRKAIKRGWSVSVHNVAARPRAVRANNAVLPFTWDADGKVLRFELPASTRKASNIAITLTAGAKQ